MKIIVGCERSGKVRDRFTALGHDVISCDLEISDKPGKHYKGDLFDILYSGFDMAICFPPCTYLSSVALWRCNYDPERIIKRDLAVDFFMKIWNSPISRICLENPTGYISSTILKPTQIIHPYYFGEAAFKRTCLWLKNLPPLLHSPIDTLFETRTHLDKPAPLYIQPNGKRRHFVDCAPNAKIRSVTFDSIADAMSRTWGNLNNYNND